MNDRRVAVVIEQDQEVCALLCATLGEAGFEVHCSDNGEAGLALVRAMEPDTVTLNAVLPDVDGNPFALGSLRGQKVLLVAWASW